jgi:uncharacterized membrane protein YcaP (DUF421 family)
LESEALMELLRDLLGLGLEPKDLGVVQVSLRAVIIFLAALLMVRTGAKRFLGRKTAFDFILILILGSMLSRAVNGSAPLLATLAAGFVLVWFHRAVAALSFRFNCLGTFFKGTDDLIIRNGEIQQEALRKHYLSENDLMEDLRLRSVADPSQVQEARLERSGELSVVRKPA